MKPLKMLAATALAALMAMSFVGVSSAMAESTDLCTADENPCAEGNVVTHLHETSVGKAKILSTLPTIECTVLFLGEAAEESGSVFNGVYTYSSCNNFCSVKEVAEYEEEEEKAELGATVTYLKVGTDLAEATSANEIHISCPFISCTYNIESPEEHGLGALTSSSTNGSTVVSEQEIAVVSGSCPEQAFLDLTTTPLSKTYITTGGETMLCDRVRRGMYLLRYSGSECKSLMLPRIRRYELTWSRT